MRTLLLGAVALCAGLPMEADMVNVRNYGAAGDGKTDDTTAFEKAIEVASQTGTGTLVSKGTYRLSRTLKLKGALLAGPEGAAWPADIDALPTLLADHRDGPCIELGAGGAIRGLSIDYKWRTEPESGPPAILISGVGVYISNLRIRYAWDGILTDGKTNVGRLNIENVFMVAIRNIGVRVTGTWDVPRLNNVEVWNAGPVKRGLESGVGFLLGKNDLIRLTDCFAFAMGTGFLLDEKLEGCTVEGPTWGVMNGCSTDFCGRSLVVRGGHTLSVSGGTFWTHGESLLVEGKGARVRVTGSELKSNGAPCIAVRGGNHTVVTGCTLRRAMKEHPGPAVILEKGETILGNNHILAQGDGVVVGAGVRSAIVQGNIISTPNARPVSVAEGAQAVVENNLSRELPDE